MREGIVVYEVSTVHCIKRFYCEQVNSLSRRTVHSCSDEVLYARNVNFSNLILGMESNAVLHWVKPNSANYARVKFGVCPNQIRLIWSDWGVLHALPAVNNAWRPTGFGSNANLRMSRTKRITKGPVRHHFDFTTKNHWLGRESFCYFFGVAVRFDWIKFGIWLKQAFF